MKTINTEGIRKRINSINIRKYSQLVNNGANMIEKKIKILKKEINEIKQESSNDQKWSSPFKNKNTIVTKFEGKNLIPRKI